MSSYEEGRATLLGGNAFGPSWARVPYVQQ